MKYVLLSLVLLVACEGHPRHPEADATAPATPEPIAAKPAPADEVPADYSQVLENLSGSSYYYRAHVYNISVRTVKKAFEQRSDAYSAPVYSDGKRLSFNFDMTNHYDKYMQAPIPEYFRLQAACFDYGQGSHAANTSYNRTAKTYELGGSQLTTAEGSELYKVPSASRAAVTGYRLPFKPHQTRRFKVVFDHAFAPDCQQVVLLGFTRADQEPREQVYVGLFIDVATGTIVDQQLCKRYRAFFPTK